MLVLEPSTALTPTSNWRLGFQSVGVWFGLSSTKPSARFSFARPGVKAPSRAVLDVRSAAARAQRIAVRKAATTQARLRYVCGSDFRSGQPVRRIIGGHETPHWRQNSITNGTLTASANHFGHGWT